jgi:hypothetical protein
MMNSYPQQPPGQQQGSVLLVTMVFLLLFAIVATAVFRGSQTSVQAVGNMQWRTEAINATNEVVANILSDYAGFIQPALTHGMNGPGAPSGAFSSDVNGDGNPDISVNVTNLECNYVAPVKWEDLDEENPEDQQCFGSSANQMGEPPAVCSEVQFAVTLTATDTVSEANVQIEQGVGVRVNSVADVCNF